MIATVPWGIPITQEVNRLTSELDSLIAQLQPSPWQSVGLLAGWVNAGGFLTTAYRLEYPEIVALRGQPQRTGGAGTGGDENLFTLPLGFRPMATVAFSASTNRGTSTTANITVRISIAPSGVVTMSPTAAWVMPVNTAVSLDGVRFSRTA